VAGEPPQATFLDYSVNLRIIRDCAGPLAFFSWISVLPILAKRAGQVTVAARCFAPKNCGKESRNKLENSRLRLE
jgi:hypothetical protein